MTRENHLVTSHELICHFIFRAGTQFQITCPYIEPVLTFKWAIKTLALFQKISDDYNEKNESEKSQMILEIENCF